MLKLTLETIPDTDEGGRRLSIGTMCVSDGPDGADVSDRRVLAMEGATGRAAHRGMRRARAGPPADRMGPDPRGLRGAHEGGLGRVVRPGFLATSPWKVGSLESAFENPDGGGSRGGGDGGLGATGRRRPWRR
jgi:hypothetical protein